MSETFVPDVTLVVRAGGYPSARRQTRRVASSLRIYVDVLDTITRAPVPDFSGAYAIAVAPAVGGSESPAQPLNVTLTSTGFSVDFVGTVFGTWTVTAGIFEPSLETAKITINVTDEAGVPTGMTLVGYELLQDVAAAAGASAAVLVAREVATEAGAAAGVAGAVESVAPLAQVAQDAAASAGGSAAAAAIYADQATENGAIAGLAAAIEGTTMPPVAEGQVPLPALTRLRDLHESWSRYKPAEIQFGDTDEVWAEKGAQNLDAWSRVVAAGVTEVEFPRRGYVFTDGIDMPPGFSLRGMGGPQIGTFPLDDDKRFLAPGQKHLLPGTTLLFLGAGSKRLITQRTDRFQDFSYCVRAMPGRGSKIAGLTILADFNYTQSDGTVTDISNDGRALFDVGLVNDDCMAMQLEDVRVSGYFPLAGTVYRTRAFGSGYLADPDYCVWRGGSTMGDFGLALIGSEGADGTQAGLSGSQFFGVEVFSKDHHNRRSNEIFNDWGSGSLFIDGHTGAAGATTGLDGHYFFGGCVRTSSNTPLVLDRCTGLTLAGTICEWPKSFPRNSTTLIGGTSGSPFNLDTLGGSGRRSHAVATGGWFVGTGLASPVQAVTGDDFGNNGTNGWQYFAGGCRSAFANPTATARTGDVAFLNARINRNSSGIFGPSFAGAMTRAMHIIGGQSGEITTANSGGMIRLVSDESTGDQIIQMSETTASGVPGWTFRRDASEANDYVVRYAGTELYRLQTNGSIIGREISSYNISGQIILPREIAGPSEMDGSGAVTITNRMAVARVALPVGATEGTLLTINCPTLRNGQVVTVRPAVSTYPLIIGRTGNIRPTGSASVTLLAATDYVTLVYDDGLWREMARSITWDRRALASEWGADLTIAADTVTVTGSRHRLRSEVAGTADDLRTINGLRLVGQRLLLSIGSGSEPITLRDGVSGNLRIKGDCLLPNTFSRIELEWDGAFLAEISRSIR